MEQEAYDEIAREILEKGSDVQAAKAGVCRKYSLRRVPSNTDVLSSVSKEKRGLLLEVLKKKPVRTLSGVAVVAVMTSPEQCPHGRCQYCPTGENSPQSYTGFEPAALRAKRAGFDPFIQVLDRLKQLHANGHNVEKTELIVMGGTFPAREPLYQEWFIKRCFDAMNSFANPHETSGENLWDAHRLNETAGVRNVGVTFETRPDYAGKRHVDDMLRLGATRIEMGVQTLREDVYERMERGHLLQDVIDSTRIIKDSGLKLGYHMMPGLFSTIPDEVEMFERLFSSLDFKPDMLKIYPVLVLEGTALYDMWLKGEFKPFTDEEAVRLIVEIKKSLPKWVRTMRIQRDIPAGLIKAGVRKGNLGELVQERLEEEGIRCRCIRCREAGLLLYKKGLRPKGLLVLDEWYQASLGKEHFISMEDVEMDLIAGYLRMRFPSHLAHREELAGESAVVRELKVLGMALRIGERSPEAGQHRGIGKTLLERAEEIASAEGMERLLVNSAVGTREYYKKMGFERIGPYMGKTL